VGGISYVKRLAMPHLAVGGFVRADLEGPVSPGRSRCNSLRPTDHSKKVGAGFCVEPRRATVKGRKRSSATLRILKPKPNEGFGGKADTDRSQKGRCWILCLVWNGRSDKTAGVAALR